MNVSPHHLLSFSASGAALDGPFDQRGATLVEAVVGIAFLFIFLFTGLDLLWAGFRVVSLQYIAERTLRSAVPRAATAGEVGRTMFSLAHSLNVELDPGNSGRSNFVSLCPVDPNVTLTASPCPGTIDLGESGQLLVLRIEIPLRNLFVSGLKAMPFTDKSVVIENRAMREYSM